MNRYKKFIFNENETDSDSKKFRTVKKFGSGNVISIQEAFELLDSEPILKCSSFRDGGSCIVETESYYVSFPYDIQNKKHKNYAGFKRKI